MELKELLKLTVERGASDLHISPNLSPWIRIGGELHEVNDLPPLTAEDTHRIIYSAMTPDQKKEFEARLELDFGIMISEFASFRVNAFHQLHGIAAVLRVIPMSIPTLDELELPPVFKNILNLPNGLILVTGPTGSGKSTTLAAMVEHINMKDKSHIITIEDPIEFIHDSKKSLINQRQVHRDTHDFNAALRSALREDPDVILLGEMRDLETIRLALTAAETGHLVLATLHTSSAPRTVNRIVDVFPANEKNNIRNLLSESLQAVLCQTLVSRKNGGRVAALEVMIGTPAIRNLIREDKIAQMITAMQTGSEVGMCTLDQYLEMLVHKGVVTQDVAARAAFNKKLFHQEEIKI